MFAEVAKKTKKDKEKKKLAMSDVPLQQEHVDENIGIGIVIEACDKWIDKQQGCSGGGAQGSDAP